VLAVGIVEVVEAPLAPRTMSARGGNPQFDVASSPRVPTARPLCRVRARSGAAAQQGPQHVRGYDDGIGVT
jgi:hypothetical protein